MLLFVIDADPAARLEIARVLAGCGHDVRAHATAAELLAHPDLERTEALVLDCRLPDHSIPALLAELARRGIEAPAVCVAAQADVPTCVAAMKAGAVDFLPKPLVRERLCAAVAAALERAATIGQRRAARARTAGLTPRERDVLALVVEGRRNLDVARLLGISLQTAKVHRYRGMAKLHVASVPDLVRLWVAAHTGAASRWSPKAGVRRVA